MHSGSAFLLGYSYILFVISLCIYFFKGAAIISVIMLHHHYLLLFEDVAGWLALRSFLWYCSIHAATSVSFSLIETSSSPPPKAPPWQHAVLPDRILGWDGAGRGTTVTRLTTTLVLCTRRPSNHQKMGHRSDASRKTMTKTWDWHEARIQQIVITL